MMTTPRHPKGHIMNILIAEDELTIAQGIGTIIRQESGFDCRIYYSENGRSAMEKARIIKPDLTFTDIRMHYMDGLELTSALKKENLCQNIVIISGYGEFEYAQTALRLGVLDYLLKPIEKSRLLEIVRSVWEKMPSSYSSAMPVHVLDNIPNIPVIKLNDSSYPTSLKRFLKYLQENYMNDLNLQSVSEELFFNPNYISTLINKHLGVSFCFLLDYIRLTHACELMNTHPEKTNAEISYLVGYAVPRRFYSAFQKRLQCTPSQFRNRLADPVSCDTVIEKNDF